MPEQYRSQKRTISQYQGKKPTTKEEKLLVEKYCKLGKKITDNVEAKLKGVTVDSPEYWGLREILTEDEVDVLLKLKLRKWYTFEQLYKMNKKQFSPVEFNALVDQLCNDGIIEYDYGDHYNDNGPITDVKWEKRYRLSFYVPGSAELFNSTIEKIEKNPPVASFFERMTFLPLEKVTSMVRPGGNGIGMHVIPVEKEVTFNNEAVKTEKISYWLKKYEGHLSAGLCSCRHSRAVLGEGCEDDPRDWCIQVGDMADYAVETKKARPITKEEALDILKQAEKNGYVHQITNIDGADHIFDICNCNVDICNALRTSLLYNTPYMSKSGYVANVDKNKCVACGACTEVCPAGAAKLGQKLCAKNGPVKYPKQILPNKIHWGKYAWDENYRNTIKYHTHDSGTSPCKVACPAHVPVQGYLQLAKEGKYVEALALIKKENPFPAVCGRVCNKRCEDACTRGTIDDPVSIDAVKKFVADYEIKQANRYVPEKIIKNATGKPFNNKIAIIGGGPAGLSCAYYLAVKGYTPTVFEKNDKPGGMLRYGIPEYKLEKSVIDAEIDIIKKLGVEIKCGVEVGKDISIEELKKQGYEAFYVAIGCQGGRLPGLENEKANGTFVALDFLKQTLSPNKPKLSGNVVVIGGGNVAFDCARSATRLGASKVTVVALEEEGKMLATNEEISESKEENIEIINSYGPKRIAVNGGKVSGLTLKKCTQTIDPATLKFAPKYDETDTKELQADYIIFAIGQEIVWGDLLKGTNVKFWKGNYPVADKYTYQTGDDCIFVGGDVNTGPKFVIDAIAQGHEASESLARFVSKNNVSQTLGRDRRYFVSLNKQDIILEGYDNAFRQKEGMDTSFDYHKSFKDAHNTFTEAQVKTETKRCLSCGQSIIDTNRCIGCGLCTTKCEFDAIHLIKNEPKCSDLRKAENKVTGLLSYAAKRGVKIIFNSLSKDARIMRKRRKEFKKANKNNPNKHTGYSVPPKTF